MTDYPNYKRSISRRPLKLPSCHKDRLLVPRKQFVTELQQRQRPPPQDHTHNSDINTRSSSCYDKLSTLHKEHVQVSFKNYSPDTETDFGHHGKHVTELQKRQHSPLQVQDPTHIHLHATRLPIQHYPYYTRSMSKTIFLPQRPTSAIMETVCH